ncbi:MAG: hypothetical protein IJ748_05545 [Bacteroidales bacterium]|nr:hypothetical protein [Bacteroidales bacterium]
MKRLIVLIMALGLLSIPSFAQRKDKDRVKPNEKRVNLASPEENALKKDRHEFSPEQLEKDHQRMLELKRRAFEKELKLQGDSFEKFWELYLSYDKEMFVLNFEELSMMNKLKENAAKAEGKTEFDLINLDPAQAEEVLSHGIEIEKRKMDLKFKYNEVFKGVIGPQGVLKLKEVEQKLEKRNSSHRDAMRKDVKSAEGRQPATMKKERR